MIDTLLFDLDNTLLDLIKQKQNALSKALHDVNIKVDDLMLIRYNSINKFPVETNLKKELSQEKK
mgnify:CR=1 FL=1